MTPRRVLLALVGITLVRLTTTGQYKHYVRERTGALLLVAGAVLLLLVAADIVLSRSSRLGAKSPENENDHSEHENGHDHGHDHSAMPNVGWLLLFPIAIAFIVAPPALGSWGLNRSNNKAVAAILGSNFLPLVKSNEIRPMGTNEFVARALDGDGSSLNGATIALEGFVSEISDTSVTIARYSIACCAADGVAAQLNVNLTTPIFVAEGDWLRVVGTLDRVDEKGKPVVNPESVEPISPPANTYEE
jgi:uncharacterized repeat protein (TIGR03943 family)